MSYNLSEYETKDYNLKLFTRWRPFRQYMSKFTNVLINVNMYGLTKLKNDYNHI